MKNQTKKVLQKTGVILAMVMIFTMLAVPAWATSESNSGGDTTVPGVGGRCAVCFCIYSYRCSRQ